MVFELKFLDSCTSNKSITIGRKCRKVQLFCRNSNSSFSAALSLNSSNVSIDNFLFRQKFRWNPLLVFGAYVICKKNYSSRRVVFLFFNPKLSTVFIQKQMTAVGLGQQGFQALGPGSSLSRAKELNDFTDICQKLHSNDSHGTVGRTRLLKQQGRTKFSEILKGSPRYFSAIWDKKLPTENSDIPSVCIKFFDTPW